jgi:hypothetical protein
MIFLSVDQFVSGFPTGGRWRQCGKPCPKMVNEKNSIKALHKLYKL